MWKKKKKCEEHDETTSLTFMLNTLKKGSSSEFG